MRRLLSFTVIVLMVLVAADRAVWFVARRGLATALQQQTHAAQRPDVQIAGFPLLTQAVRGVYDQVDISAKGVGVENGVTLDTVDTRLKGVHLTLQQMIDQDVSRLPVEHGDVRATVGYPSLTNVVNAQIPGDTVKVVLGPAGPDTVKVTGEFTTPVFSGSLAGEARPVLSGGNVVVTVLADSLTGVPALFRTQVAKLLGVTLAVPVLPLDFRATGLVAGPKGVTLTAEGDDVVLQPVAAGR